MFQFSSYKNWIHRSFDFEIIEKIGIDGYFLNQIHGRHWQFGTLSLLAGCCFFQRKIQKIKVEYMCLWSNNDFQNWGLMPNHGL
jgi:hypothetical protein